jgi:hypothetical protein
MKDPEGLGTREVIKDSSHFHSNKSSLPQMRNIGFIFNTELF